MRRRSQATSARPAARAAGTAVAGRKARGLFGLGCVCVLGFAAFLGSGASSVGAAESFPGQGFLPDNRAWEMVSPPDKNGADVIQDATATRAAADGSAISFASLVGFGNVLGSSTSTESLARRTAAPGTNGWLTNGITPPQEPLNFFAISRGAQPQYDGEFSDDLSHGVFRSWSPVTDVPDVARVENLYLRSDLLSGGSGTYDLVTACPACAGTPLLDSTVKTFKPGFAGASDDFSTIIFESQSQLTSDAGTGTNVRLYRWADGTVQLLKGPTNTGCPSNRPCSIAGFGLTAGRSASRAISANGSRVIFTSPVNNGGNPVTTGPAANQSKIFAFDDQETDDTADDTTTQVNLPNVGVSSTAVGANYWTASRDGSKIFFTTLQKLTENASAGKPHLYMYDLNAPVGSKISLIDAEPAGGNPYGGVLGVVGASEDGTYVYFVGGGNLDQSGPVQSEPDRTLYLWHEGDIHFIGAFADAAFAPVLLNVQWAISLTRLDSRVTPDGRHMVFGVDNDAGFAGSEVNSCASPKCHNYYVYSADDAHLTCATCPETGTATATAAINVRNSSRGATTPTTHVGRSLSDDGQYVYFTTAERLVPEDINGVADAYQFDTETSEQSLISSGEDESPSYFLDASSSGSDIFFATRERLSSWDTDSNYDLYDARAGGGLPEPQPAPPSCQGDACQPTPADVTDQTPSSSGFAGPGDPVVTRSRNCAKHKVKRAGKARCKKSPRHHKRATNTKRRAGR